MPTEKNDKWVEGFAEKAAALGLSVEGAKQLLKFSGMFEQAADPRFQEGFTKASEEMKKNAIGVGGHLGEALFSTIGKAFKGPMAVPSTLGALGTLGAGYYGLYRPYVGKGQYERDMQQLRDAVDYGFMSEEQASAALQERTARQAESMARYSGGRVQKPTFNSGWGGYNPYSGY